jgi:hypothetical protein
MKKLFTLLLLGGTLTANAQYQLKNAGFEEWEEVSYKTSGFLGTTYQGEEPLNWNSFLTGTGGLKGTAGRNQLEKVSEVRPGSLGQYSAKLFARKAFGSIFAQGNLTTGCINMGSITANDASGNYNFTDVNDDNLNQKFSGLPDAMHIWVKYISTNSEFPYGKVNTILHTEGYYQDPLANNITAKLVAKAEKIDIVNSNEWQELTIPFVYENGINERPAYALVSFATNTEPGKGKEGDYMLVDDLEYLYYSELATLTYDGQSFFKEGTTHYDLSDKVYDTEKISFSSNGHGATIIPQYNEENHVLTLTVKGDDWSESNRNEHVYTIQFKEPVTVIETQTYNGSLLVNAFGEFAAPTQNSIELIKYSDNSYSFSLKNFVFMETPMGDIVVNNLDVIKQGNTTVYSKENELVMIEGLGTAVPVTLTAWETNGVMTAKIYIPLEGMGEVNVTFAPALVIDGLSAVSIENAGLHNVTLSRTFPAGWSTICLPFTTSTAMFGTDVKAQAFASADDNGLNFEEVTKLDANKPYLIYFPSETTTPVYLSADVKTTTPESVTFGDFTFCGSYEASIRMAGKYGVADQGNVQKLMLGGEGSTLKATRAYFTKSGDQPAMININLDGNATGIENIEQNQADIYDVYNLQGQLIRKNATSLNGLAKGIYIVNGKKVMVK